MRKILLFACGIHLFITAPAQMKAAGSFSEPFYWWPISLLLIGLFLVVIYRYARKVASLRLQETKNKELSIYRREQYHYQLEMEHVINYFTHSIYSKRNAEEMLWDVTKNCISKLGFEDCVIYLVNTDNNTLVQKAAWGPKTTEENKILNPLVIPVGKGIVGYVAQSGIAEIINDTALDDRYILDDKHRLAELCVPIIQQGEVIGIIDCEHSEKDFYNGRHLQIMETIAAVCAGRLQKIAADEEIHANELHVATLKESLAASQLTALRAQMNPHFIFNALNSVQQFTLTGDVDQANRYLTKFSRLQREILHHCDQHFISLEKEIEMLRLYLEFEQLRFSDTFEYSISLHNELDPSEIQIPPMILQPFVENAIWHGLMPKQGDKQLQLLFSFLNADTLHCHIKDNGIGTAASQRLKQNNLQANLHKSKGLNLASERLKILEQQYKKPFQVNVADVTNDEGTVTGTSVELQIFIGEKR